MLDELRANLQEALDLCLDEMGSAVEDLRQFVGVQQIEIAS